MLLSSSDLLPLRALSSPISAYRLESGEKETMQRIKDVKESIEKLFSEYYKKRIRITN